VAAQEKFNTVLDRSKRRTEASSAATLADATAKKDAASKVKQAEADLAKTQQTAVALDAKRTTAIESTTRAFEAQVGKLRAQGGTAVAAVTPLTKAFNDLQKKLKEGGSAGSVHSPNMILFFVQQTVHMHVLCCGFYEGGSAGSVHAPNMILLFVQQTVHMHATCCGL
jgi:hypothetical protein